MKRSVIDGIDFDSLMKKLEEAKAKGKTDMENILIPLMMESPVLEKVKQSGPSSLRIVAESEMENRIDKLL